MPSLLPAIWQRKLKPIDHQIIWWLLDVGAPGKLLMHGWQVIAANHLEIHRITLRRRVQVLTEAGILVEGDKKGTVMLDLRIFTSKADRTKVRMMPATKRMIKR